MQRLSLTAAIAIVVANMVGTGVFTSLGFQLLGLTDWRAIVALWLVGGLIALAGALTYAELASHLPSSGGEYHYLSALWHPRWGALSAWVSATVGFSAPTALASIAMGKYLQVYWPAVSAQGAATSIILLLALLHATSMRWGARVQVIFTTAKVLVMIGIIAVAFALPSAEPLLVSLNGLWAELGSQSFAVSLIYVSYAYSGWNAATYLAGEVKNPKITVPIALIGGTALVMLLYAGLNLSLLKLAPPAVLMGKVEVAAAAFTHRFGQEAGTLLSVLIAVLLVSTISAMSMAGPRLLAALGDAHNGLSWLAFRNKHNLPVGAIIIQTTIALAFVWTGTFEQVLVFSGGLLCLFTMLTTAAIFRLRIRVAQGLYPPDGSFRFKAWGYPIPPLVFLALNGYMLVFLALDRPTEMLYSLLLLLIGWGISSIKTG